MGKDEFIKQNKEKKNCRLFFARDNGKGHR